MTTKSLQKETLHIYLDEQSLKMAKTLLVGGKRVIGGLYYKDMTGVSDLNVSIEIAQGMAALKSRVRSAYLVLPAKYVMTKSIEVPSLDHKEIHDIVRLQAIRHTPYSKEEVIVGHMSLDVILERYTKTLLVIAASENVRRKTDAMELAGLAVAGVHLALEAVSEQVVASLALSRDASNVGVIFLDHTSTDIFFLNKLKPVFTRSLPLGTKNLQADAEAVGKQLLEELKKTVEAFQAEDANAVPKRYVLIGPDTPEQKIILKKFEDELKIRFDASVGELQMPLTEDAKKDLANFRQVTFMDVISDALFYEKACMDIIPEDLVLRRAFQAKGREIFMAGIVFVVLFFIIMGIFLSKIYFRKSYLAEIHKNFELRQKEADELVGISEDSRAIRDFEAKKGTALTVLNELQTILPAEMYLSEMSLSPENKLSIKGTSDLMSAVFAFVTQFENHPLFKSVNPDYTKSRKENDRDVSDFGISAELDPLGAQASATPSATPAVGPAVEPLPAAGEEAKNG